MKRLVCVLAMVCWTSSSHAQGAIGSGVVVSTLVEQMTRAAQQIVHQLDQSVSVNSFQIRQHLMVLISELEHAAISLESKTFQDLDKQQQSLFRDIDNAIAEASRAVNAPLAQADQISKNLESAVARLPLADKSPRVTNIRPDHLVSPANAAPVRIVVEGNQLGYGPAVLKLAGQACSSASQTDTSLSFLCPSSLFRTLDSFKNVEGSLVVADNKSFWDKIKDVFRYNDPLKNYRVLVVAVPPKLGVYSLEVGYIEQSQQTKPASGPFSANNPHCNGQTTYSLNYSVQNAGYSIVPGSVTFTETSGDQQRSMDGPLDFTPAGFRMQSTLKNGGSCGPREVWKDARAHQSGTVSWLESLNVNTTKVETHPETPILWGSDIVITLPDRTSYFKLFVRQADGSKPIVIDKDNTQKWFRVEKSEKLLKISPRQVEEALRL